MVDWQDHILPELQEAFARADTLLIDELRHGVQSALLLLADARKTLESSLSDDQLEEAELIAVRLDFLKAQAALKPISGAVSPQLKALERITRALSACADCFKEHSLVTELRVSPVLGNAPMSFDVRTVTVGEFCLEVLESRVDTLLEVVREGLPPPPEDDEPVFLPEDEPASRPYTTALAYLDTVAHYAIPGVIYGSEGRKENAWSAARAMKAGCERVQRLLAERMPGADPLERLREMEATITTLIEEVRLAGGPLTSPGRLKAFFKPDRVGQVRAMLADLSPIEGELSQLLEDWT